MLSPPLFWSNASVAGADHTKAVGPRRQWPEGRVGCTSPTVGDDADEHTSTTVTGDEARRFRRRRVSRRTASGGAGTAGTTAAVAEVCRVSVLKICDLSGVRGVVFGGEERRGVHRVSIGATEEESTV